MSRIVFQSFVVACLVCSAFLGMPVCTSVSQVGDSALCTTTMQIYRYVYTERERERVRVCFIYLFIYLFIYIYIHTHTHIHMYTCTSVGCRRRADDAPGFLP